MGDNTKPEIEELIEEGSRHERLLMNGGRGSVDALSDAVGYLIRVNRVQLKSRHVTPEELSAHCMSRHKGLGWPAAVTAIGLMISILTVIARYAG